MARYYNFLTPVDAVQILAADYNRQEFLRPFDSPPFSEHPDWLTKVMVRGDVVVDHQASRETDYAMWKVRNDETVTTIGPGDWIVKEGNQVYGVKAEVFKRDYEQLKV
jgi:hypothetical protein